MHRERDNGVRVESEVMPAIPKQAIKATKAGWKRLVGECFARDGRCQLCKRVKPFIPHHIIPKGRVRIDALWNLLTLCHDCHAKLHAGQLSISIDGMINKYSYRKETE